MIGDYHGRVRGGEDSARSMLSGFCRGQGAWQMHNCAHDQMRHALHPCDPFRAANPCVSLFETVDRAGFVASVTSSDS